MNTGILAAMASILHFQSQIIPPIIAAIVCFWYPLYKIIIFTDWELDISQLAVPPFEETTNAQNQNTKESWWDNQ